MRLFSSCLTGIGAGLALLQFYPMLVSDTLGQACFDASLARAQERVGFCTRVLERNLPAPQRARALAYRGLALMNNGEDARAMPDFDAALALVPNMPMALLDRAVLRARAGAYEAALADLERVGGLQAETVDVLAVRGFIHFHQGNLQAADADVARLEQLSPANAWAHNLHGTILARMGKIASARSQYDIAAKLEPANSGFGDDLRLLAADAPP